MNHDQMNHNQMDHSMHTTASSMHSGHHGHATQGESVGHEGMMMWFHFSEKAVILFKGWQTTTWAEMLGSCIAVLVLAALYEGLKVGREQLLRRTRVMVQADNGPTSEAAGGLMNGGKQTTVSSLRITHPIHILQSFLHILQVVISYFLMLVFMTYNGWLCISVGVGAGLGYFLFSWKRAVIVDINEHCH